MDQAVDRDHCSHSAGAFAPSWCYRECYLEQMDMGGRSLTPVRSARVGRRNRASRARSGTRNNSERLDTIGDRVVAKADSGPAPDGVAILARVGEIGTLLRESAPEVEAARHLAAPVVGALRSTGAFRMSMPEAWGGPELDICTQIEIIETLSRADASVGWCAMIGSDSGHFSGFLDDAGPVALSRPRCVTAGWVVPAGTLEVCDGGYRLSGRWSFGSGSIMPTYIHGRCSHHRERVASNVGRRRAKSG